MTSQPINPIGLKQLSDMTGGLFNQMMDVFTKDIPKGLSISFGKKNEEHSEAFIKQLMEKMMAQLPVTLMSLIPMMLSFPTKFHWELSKHLLEASAKVKRELVPQYLSQDYDVEADIKRTKEELEAVLSREFKTEVVLWRLMDEQRWAEALPIVKTIEIEREKADLRQKTEVANWKQQIAINLGDVDMFFKAISSLLKIAGNDVSYQADEMTYGITILLSKVVVGINLTLTPIGHIIASKKGPAFIVEQAIAFQNYLVKKLIDAIFKERTINTGEDFKKFITETKKDTIEIFKTLNPYVSDIIY